ncbi:MAG TPA: crosslink repair DNA glycosylase YcaQ family protein, partial [Ilumatobacteraceae bacterium]|nr:crosslink repair DNA glycosylase YcaQ family protein [Ilumatobacteraceae bacterium]
MPAEKISLGTARRIALGAQGFAEPRPNGRVDRRHFRRVLDRMGLIQIDSVNVLVRSQELPLFARLGPHPRTLITDATKSRELFEYWVHEASHVDMGHYQLHRWKMERDHR